MTAGVAANISVRLNGDYYGVNDLGTVQFQFDQATLFSLLQGTATGLADLMFADTRTLAASANESLDLAGSLVDPLGAVLTFVKIKAIWVKANSANTNSVIVGAGTNPFVGPLGGTTPTVTIPPGGVMLLVHPGAGWTVTASTGDILKFANSSSGTGVTYDLILIGTSA